MNFNVEVYRRVALFLIRRDGVTWIELFIHMICKSDCDNKIELFVLLPGC
jgi:hypothetical protein